MGDLLDKFSGGGGGGGGFDYGAGGFGTPQQREVRKLRGEARQAHARGILTTSEYETLEDEYKTGNTPSFIQRVMFDMAPAIFTDTSKPTENPFSGGVLETIGDVLSVGNYAVASGANQAMQTSEVGGVKNPWGIGGAAAGAVVGGLVGGPPGAVIGAGVGAVGGTIFDDGTSLEGFAKDWRNRTTFTKINMDNNVFGDDIWGNLAVGLVSDILLDPTTYMTFGVSAGAKTALTGTMKASAKGLGKSGKRIANVAEVGQELTLNRFGERMYQLSADTLVSGFRNNVEKGGHVFDAADAAAMHHEILENMVKNFDSLSKTLYQRSKASKFRALSFAGQAQQDVIRGSAMAKKYGFGFAADDMFQETASVLARERMMYNGQGLAKKLAGMEGPLPRLGVRFVGSRGIVAKTFDTFSKGWDAPQEFNDARRIIDLATADKLDESYNRYTTAFSGLDEASRKTVTREVERRVWGTGEHYAGPNLKYSDEIEEAISFVKTEFADILKIENDNGYGVLEASGYVSHLYNLNPRIKNWVEGAIKKNGIERYHNANDFTQQRIIASVAEGIDMFGDGGLVEDSYKLMMWRKRASVEMMARDKLFSEAAKHSLPMAMIADQKRGFAKGLFAGWFRRNSHGVHKIISVDQVWQDKDLNYHKLGFDGDTERTRGLIRYLTMDPDDTGRFSEAGQALAAKLDLGDDARMFVKTKESEAEVSGFIADIAKNTPPKRTIRVSPGSIKTVGIESAAKSSRETGFEIDVNDAIEMLHKPEHPRWEQIMLSSEGGKKNPLRALSVYKALQRWSINELQIPFDSLFDYRKTVSFAPKEEGGKATSGFTNGALEAIVKHHGGDEKALRSLSRRATKIMDEASAKKVEQILVPQVPPEMIQMGRATRAALGPDLHRVPAVKGDVDALMPAAVELGFTNRKLLEEMIDSIVGPGGIRTKHDVDAVEQTFMAILHDDKFRKLKGMGFVDAPEQLRRYKGQRLVLRSFEASPTVSDSGIMPSLVDQDLAIKSADVVDPDDIVKLGDGEAIPTPPSMELSVPRAQAPWPAGREISEAAKSAVKERDLAGTRYRRLKKAYDVNTRIVAKFVEEKTPLVLRALEAQEAGLKNLRNARNDLKAWSTGRKVTKNKVTTTIRKTLDEVYEPTVKLVRELFGEDKLQEMQAAAAKVSKSDEALSAELKGSKLKHKTDTTLTPEKIRERFTRAAYAKIRERLKGANEDWRAAKGAGTLKVYRGKRKALRKARTASTRSHRNLRNAEARVHDATRLPTEPSVGGIENIGSRQVHQPQTPSEALRKLRVQQSRLMGVAIERSGATNSDIVAAIDGAPNQSLVDRIGEDVYSELLDIKGKIDASKYALTDPTANSFGPFAGLKRPKRGGKIALVMPEGVAAVMDDIFVPGVDPAIKGVARKILNGFDAIQHYYKANLLAPHSAYWARNIVQNVAVTSMRVWSSFLDPSGGFRNARDNAAMMSYIIARHGKVDTEKAREIGDRVVTTYLGRKTTIRELDLRMREAGVYRGMASAEGIDNAMLQTGTMASRAASGLSGAAAGATAGAAVGMGADAIAGTQEDGPGMTYGSALTGALGAFFGVRNISKANVGQPYKVANKITGLLRSDWRPMIDKGELYSEVPFRTAVYMHEYLGTSSHKAARQAVYDTLNDWHSLSANEKNIMKRAIPFYSWTKHAVKHTLKEAYHNPGRQLNFVKIFRSWNQAHDVKRGDRRDFLDNRFAMVANSESPLIGRMIGEKEIVNISGLGLPIEDFSAMVEGLTPTTRKGIIRDAAAGDPMLLVSPWRWNRSAKDREQFTSAILSRGPFGVVAGIELMLNKDTFTGGPINSPIETTMFEGGDKWAGAPGWLKGIVSYSPKSRGKKATVDPTVAWMLGEVPHSRFITLMRDMKKYTEDGSKVDTMNVAKKFLGLSVYKREKKSGRYLVNKRKIEVLSAYLDSVGAINTSLRRTEVKRP
jgi:hypothetical protein